jgi:hypothetical protein
MKSAPKSKEHFGVVADDVERVNPDLVARDAEGKVYTVRYEAVNAPIAFSRNTGSTPRSFKNVQALPICDFQFTVTAMGAEGMPLAITTSWLGPCS